jgi:hypothetical protein
MIIEGHVWIYIVADDESPEKCSNDCRFFDTDDYYEEGDGCCVLFMETDDYTPELIMNMYRCQQCLSKLGMEGTDES